MHKTTWLLLAAACSASSTETPDAAPPGSACAAATARPTDLTFDRFVGLNGFIDDPLDKLAVAGIVREYHLWAWDEGDLDPGYPGAADKFDPSYGNDGGWDFDAYYRGLRDLGVEVSPAVEGNVAWMQGIGDARPTDGDAGDPAAYRAHAAHMFQLAARYGGTAVPDDALTLAGDQPRLSGLGTVGYFEDWNEPDKWWRHDDAPEEVFSPEQYGAMASADYDGDCGALGPGAGVKTADPGARMVMAGLAGTPYDGRINLPFLDALLAWSEARRPGSFPADVINVHHYTTDGEQGLSPEEGDLRGQLAEVVAWRDAHLPDRELWLSEFGWDDNPDSPQRASAAGALSARELQGAFVVRAFLAAAAAGVDRAFVFVSRDDDAADPTQYASSGLLEAPPGEAPKPAWHFVATLRERLTGMRFADQQDAGREDVWIYTFRAAGGGGAYVVWCPTATDHRAPGYRLGLSGAPATATRVTLAGDVADDLVIDAGAVTLDVGEIPTIVLVDDL